MQQQEIINEIAKNLDVIRTSPIVINKEELIDLVNNLVTHDFQKLVSILYRMDVSEKKLRTLLQEQPDRNAAETIVDLMIERQLQKIKSRKETKKNNDIPDDEKW